MYLCLFVSAYILDGPGVCFADRQTTGRDVDPSGGGRHRVTSATEARYGGVCRIHRRPRSMSDNMRQKQEAGKTAVLHEQVLPRLRNLVQLLYAKVS